MKKNIILTDFEPSENWDFLKGLHETSKKKWEVQFCVSNQLRTNLRRKIVRYVKYFLFPMKINLHRKEYDRIIAWQQFYGLVFAFFARLFHERKVNDLTVMTFIYKEKKGFMGVLYYKFIKYCVSSRYIDRLVVFTKHEAQYYSDIFDLPKSKFECMNLGISDVSGKYDLTDNGRFLSVGRSNRDYEFLFSSLKGTDIQLDILCDVLNQNDTENIKIYNDIKNEKYYEKLSQCHAVIVPIKNENISSGQLVVLQAMMMRKPIIVTQSMSLADYVDNNKTALVIKKDKKELLEAIDIISRDESLYKQLQEQGRKQYEKKYSLIQLGRNIGQIIL